MEETKAEFASSTPPISTAKQFSVSTSDQLEFICEAHNGLSAKIVEEAGFKGIWGAVCSPGPVRRARQQ
ncbi:MAG: hypothetical protein U0361_04670 [Nitrospiraceae bacterium]